MSTNLKLWEEIWSHIYNVFNLLPYEHREVLASEALLNIPTRADWKECKQNREEEEECCKQLRDDFQPYDFTYDE